MSPYAMRLTLVRHGETEGQSSIRYYGRTDVPLSTLGRMQMERVHAALRAQRFAAVYSSTLARSAEAARIICAATATVTMVGFDEVDFGDWEGLTAEEIRTQDPRRFAEWAQHRGDFGYPGGESHVAFRARVVRTLHAVLADASAGDLLFVLHKGVIRCVVGELLGLPDGERGSLVAALGSVHVLSRRDGIWRAEALDRTDHL